MAKLFRANTKLLAAALVLSGLCCLRVSASEPATAGWIEKAMLYPQKLVFHAKLDTGAQTSSMHAEDLEYITRDGEEWVRTTITSHDIETAIIEAPVVREVKIKRHFGGRQTRPVILLDLCIGDVRKKEEVNLVDRTGMNYPVLIGRNFLSGSLLVDSSSTYRLTPDCSD